MTRKEYSEFLVPNVEHDVAYYENKYPARVLEEGAMVTRFAPSPTGFVHMGSLYASFIDLQMAKQSKGVAYLRIEDTDQKREVENGIEGIIKDFKNLGISFNEGPSYGGEYGPYVQSERGDIYRAYVRKLIEEDLAYPCFCTPEDLDEQRHIQELEKERIGYYGTWAKCRSLSMDEVIEKINNGEKYIIRLKSPGSFSNKVVLHDLIKGNIEMPENDIDIVILKSDNLPTYHLAHAVDDHLMHTTHVIRGDEWVASWPIHEQLFKVLKFELPNYAHIAPITVKEGNTIRKISKRKDPEAAVSYYHKLGIPTEVIRLYLATINNSTFEAWYLQNPDKTIDDFTFEFDKCPIGGSLFDIQKLISISKVYFSALKATKVYEGALEYTKEYDAEFNELLTKYKEYSINVLNIEKEVTRPRKDISAYSDVRNYTWYMFDELYFKEAKFELDKEYNIDLLKDYFDNYFDESDSKDDWFNKIKELAPKYNYASETKAYKQEPEKYVGHIGDVCEAIRVAITSLKATPDLYEILKLLGKERALKRIEFFEECNK